MSTLISRIMGTEKVFGKKVDGAMDRLLSKKEEPKQERTVKAPSLSGFIYVLSTDLYVAKERTLQNKTWYQCHEELQKQGTRMLTLKEFVEFLRYVKSNNIDIYKDITEARDPWRAEWLDADFKEINGILYMNYNHKLNGGKLVPQNSELLESCLMQDKTPGIDLEDWMNNPTKQGMPKLTVKDGGLYYWHPPSDNNSVAGFVAGSLRACLGCYGRPGGSDSSLGVRQVREAQRKK